MPVQPFIPPQWTWVYDLVCGQEWPQADEDAMRRCAQAWTDALGQLVSIARTGDANADQVLYSVQSRSSDQFQAFWDTYVGGDQSNVGQMAQNAEGLSLMLLRQAEQVEFTKISIDIQIVILLIQIIWDFAIAPLTMGASMGEAMIAAFATRMTIRQFLLFLLRGVLFAVAPDIITQLAMMADHHRDHFDFGEAANAAAMGAVGGLIGMGLGRYGGGLSKALDARLGTVAGTFVNAGLHGALTNVGTNMVMGLAQNAELQITGQDPTTQDPSYAQQKSSENPLLAALNGAFTGMLFHGAHYIHEQPITTFTTGDGTLYHGLSTGDGTYSLFDTQGKLQGVGTLDGGQLTITPKTGTPDTVNVAAMSVTHHGVTTPVTLERPAEPVAPEITTPTGTGDDYVGLGPKQPPRSGETPQEPETPPNTGGRQPGTPPGEQDNEPGDGRSGTIPPGVPAGGHPTTPPTAQTGDQTVQTQAGDPPSRTQTGPPGQAQGGEQPIGLPGQARTGDQPSQAPGSDPATAHPGSAPNQPGGPEQTGIISPQPTSAVPPGQPATPAVETRTTEPVVGGTRTIEPVPVLPPVVVDAIPPPVAEAPPVRFAAGPPRVRPGDDFLVGDGRTRHAVAQEPLAQANPRVTRPLQMDAPLDPDAPRFAPAELVGLDGITLGREVPEQGTPEYEALWKALWRATAETSREHALVRLAGSDELAIVRGGMEGILKNPDLPVSNVYLHVHPPWTEPRGISAEDAALLVHSGQDMAVLVQPGGLVRYFVRDPTPPPPEPEWPPAIEPGTPGVATPEAMRAFAAQLGVDIGIEGGQTTANHADGTPLTTAELDTLSTFLARHGQAATAPPPPPVDPDAAMYQQPGIRPTSVEEIAARYGIPPEMLDGFQRIAERYGVVIELRPTNPDAVHQREMGAVPKPEDIKAKSLQPPDLRLNPFPEDALALIRGVRPGRPVEMGTTSEEYATQLREAFQKLEAFYQRRMREWDGYHLGEQIDDLVETGLWRVTRGVVERKIGEQWYPITGDQDVFHIRRADGTPVSPLEAQIISADMISSDLAVMHGAHMHWPEPGLKRNVFADVVAKHQDPELAADPVRAASQNEPLVRVLPGEPARLVWADPPDPTDSRFEPVIDDLLVGASGRSAIIDALTGVHPPEPPITLTSPETPADTEHPTPTEHPDAGHDTGSGHHGTPGQHDDYQHLGHATGDTEPVRYATVEAGPGDAAGNRTLVVRDGDRPPIRVTVEGTATHWVLRAEGVDTAQIGARGALVAGHDGVLTIVGHATADGFDFNGRIVRFGDLTDALGGVPADVGLVQLVACDAGAGPAIQEFADHVNLPVVAADQPVWLARDGGVITSAPVNPDDPYPRIPPDGHWLLVRPHDRTTELPLGDPRAPAPPAGMLTPRDYTHASTGDGLGIPHTGDPDPRLMPEHPVEAYQRLLVRCRDIATDQAQRANELMAAGRGEGWFARVYQRVTEFELRYVEEGRYEYPIMKLQEVEAFHETYDQNLRAWLDGRYDDVEPNWRRAFADAATYRPDHPSFPPSLGILHALLGSFEAHIRFDLPRAIADVYLTHYAATGIDIEAFHPDFDAMLPVFNDAQDAVLTDIAAHTFRGDPGQVRALQGVGMKLIFDTANERVHAWNRATDLVTLLHRDPTMTQPELQAALEAMNKLRRPITFGPDTNFRVGTKGPFGGVRVTTYEWGQQPEPPGGFVRLGGAVPGMSEPERSALGYELAGAEMADADIAGTERAIREVMATPQVLPPNAETHPRALTVVLDPAGRPKVTVHIVVYDIGNRPVPEYGGHRYGPTATIHYRDPDTVDLAVSANAAPDHVRQAVAAALTEIQRTVAGDRTATGRDIASALTEGSRQDPLTIGYTLSAKDSGRVMAMRMLAVDLGNATDPLVAARLRIEAGRLLTEFGLAEKTPDTPPHMLDGNANLDGPVASALRLLQIGQAHPDQIADITKLYGMVSHPDYATLLDAIRAQRGSAHAELRAAALDLVDRHDAMDEATTQWLNEALDLAGEGTIPTPVFQKLIVGNGWAAVKDFVSGNEPPYYGSGLPRALMIGAADEPWFARGELALGQRASELEMGGMPVEARDLADQATGYTRSIDFALAGEASAAIVGAPTYHGTATAIVERPAGPAPGWPAGASYRVSVDGRMLYATDVDLVNGLGPPKLPDYRGTVLVGADGRFTDTRLYDPASGLYVDPVTHQVTDATGTPATASAATLRRMGLQPDGTWAKPPDPRAHFGGESLASDYTSGERVMVSGAGATGAWDVEQAAAAHTDLTWVAKSVDTGNINRLTQTVYGGDRPREIRDELVGLLTRGTPLTPAETVRRDALVHELSFLGGYNGRNTLSGVGAYDPGVEARTTWQMDEVTAINATVDGTFFVQFATGKPAIFDRVVFSIGQDADQMPGGAALLDPTLRQRLVPILGADGQFNGLIVDDPGGHLRVLGSASVTRAMLAHLPQPVRDMINAEALGLPYDSSGVVPSVRIQSEHIGEANRQRHTR